MMEALEKERPFVRTYNSSLFLYAGLSFLMVLLLFDYVRPSSKEPVSYLSYFIYLIGAIGLLIFYIYYTRVKKEQHCAVLTQEESEKILTDIKANGLEYQLHQFRELGTKDEDLSVNRIIGHIYTEAESKKFDSSLTIINSYKEEFASKVMRLFGFQKVALQLGILGTFIGLAMAFKDISANTIDDKAIDHLLRSLNIPFSSSIAGLQVAFIMWLHIDHLQRQQEKLFKVMEKCVDGIVNLARHAIYKDSITIELQHVSSKVDELSGRIEKTNELLHSQTNGIAEGVGKLKSANADLDLFLYGIASKQEVFSESVKSLYDSLSPEQISKELKTSLSSGAKEISGLMSTQLSDTLRMYDQVQGSMNKMTEDFKQMVATLNEYLVQLSKTDMRQQIKEVMDSAAVTINKEARADLGRLMPQLSALVTEMTTHNNYVVQQANSPKGFRKWLRFLAGKKRIRKNLTS